MKDTVTGQDVARLGDTTDHGGEVIEAAPNLTHKGVRVAFIGDRTTCGAMLQRAST